jgi:hypothetical protein
MRISNSGEVTLQDRILNKSCRVEDVRFFDARDGVVSKLTVIGALRSCTLVNVWDSLFDAELKFTSGSSGKGSLSFRKATGIVSCQFERASQPKLDQLLKRQSP